MLQLSQLDLELAFGTARTLAENLEDQLGAIQNPDLPGTLKVALLDRRDFVIEEHQVDAERLDGLANLLDLAPAQVQPRIRARPMAGSPGTDCMTRRHRKRCELIERRIIASFTTNRHTNQKGAGDRPGGTVAINVRRAIDVRRMVFGGFRCRTVLSCCQCGLQSCAPSS